MTLKEKTKEYSDALIKAGVIDSQHLEDSKEDFESGAKFVIEEIYKALNPEEVSTPMQLVAAVYECLEELERE